jgi:predicted RNA-binding Zn ribbon-like protein
LRLFEISTKLARHCWTFVVATIRSDQARVLAKAAPPKPTEYCWRPSEADVRRARSLAVERPFDVDRSKVRKRGALDCDVFYLDHSKGQQRQWRSMNDCSKREKGRRRSRLTKE